jgi:hypothetical protein
MNVAWFGCDDCCFRPVVQSLASQRSQWELGGCACADAASSHRLREGYCLVLLSGIGAADFFYSLFFLVRAPYEYVISISFCFSVAFAYLCFPPKSAMINPTTRTSRLAVFPAKEAKGAKGAKEDKEDKEDKEERGRARPIRSRSRSMRRRGR